MKKHSSIAVRALCAALAVSVACLQDAKTHQMIRLPQLPTLTPS